MNSGSLRIFRIAAFCILWLSLCLGELHTTGAFSKELAMQPGSQPDRWTIDRLMRLLAQVKQRRARYVETHDRRVLKEPLVTKGTLRFTAPSFLEKDIQEPFKERYLIEGDRLLVDRPEESDSMTLSLEEHPALHAFMEGFLAVLRGDLATLETYYALDLQGAQDQWVLRLRPLQEELRNELQSITFKGKNDQIDSIEVMHSSGARSRMIITGSTP